MLQAPFSAAVTMTLKKLITARDTATTALEEIRATGGKVIVTKGGAIVLRTAKDTVKDALKVTKIAGETSAKATGGILKDFGASLADNRKHNNRRQKSWVELNEAEEEKLQQIREKNEYYKSYDTKYDDNGN